MKRKLFYRPAALVDLNDAEIYTRRVWGDAQAKDYIAKLVTEIKQLRSSALQYPLLSMIHPNLRRKRSGMHHIYYLTSADRVEILNVIHVKRDPGARLKAFD